MEWGFNTRPVTILASGKCNRCGRLGGKGRPRGALVVGDLFLSESLAFASAYKHAGTVCGWL